MIVSKPGWLLRQEMVTQPDEVVTRNHSVVTHGGYVVTRHEMRPQPKRERADYMRAYRAKMKVAK